MVPYFCSSMNEENRDPRRGNSQEAVITAAYLADTPTKRGTAECDNHAP